MTGKEQLKKGDKVQVFFSEETITKFMQDPEVLKAEYEQLKALPMKGLRVVYEDADILIADKPYNMLSQKAKPEDVSLVEYLIAHLIHEGEINASDLASFKPGICNRLDRNTSGIVAAGKGERFLRERVSARLSDSFRMP